MPTSLAIAARTFGTSVVGFRERVWTRTWLSPMVLTVASARSGTPDSSSAVRMSSTVVAVTVVLALNSAPPENSMPRVNPRPNMAISEMAMRIAEMMYHRRLRATKS